MVEFTKTIKDPLGLHARPVALLYDIIAKHRSDVSVSIGDRHTDGRDVIGLMALCGECGEDVVFRVSGVDEASCVTSIIILSLYSQQCNKGDSPLCCINWYDKAPQRDGPLPRLFVSYRKLFRNLNGDPFQKVNHVLVYYSEHRRG